MGNITYLFGNKDILMWIGPTFKKKKNEILKLPQRPNHRDAVHITGALFPYRSTWTRELPLLHLRIIKQKQLIQQQIKPLCKVTQTAQLHHSTNLESCMRLK